MDKFLIVLMFVCCALAAVVSGMLAANDSYGSATVAALFAGLFFVVGMVFVECER